MGCYVMYVCDCVCVTLITIFTSMVSLHIARPATSSVPLAY